MSNQARVFPLLLHNMLIPLHTQPDIRLLQLQYNQPMLLLQSNIPQDQLQLMLLASYVAQP